MVSDRDIILCLTAAAEVAFLPPPVGVSSRYKAQIINAIDTMNFCNVVEVLEDTGSNANSREEIWVDLSPPVPSNTSDGNGFRTLIIRMGCQVPFLRSSI